MQTKPVSKVSNDRLGFSDHSLCFFVVVDKSFAWNKIVTFSESFGVGASRSNYLSWVASRDETRWNNASSKVITKHLENKAYNVSVRHDCKANSACGAIGRLASLI